MGALNPDPRVVLRDVSDTKTQLLPRFPPHALSIGPTLCFRSLPNFQHQTEEAETQGLGWMFIVLELKYRRQVGEICLGCLHVHKS